MDTKSTIELILAGIMVLGLIALFINRYQLKKGIGARVIQYTGVVLVVPLIGILALESVLDKQTTGTVIGALLGYLLSGISNFDSNSSDTKKKDPV